MSVSESPKFWTESIRRVDTTPYQAEIIFHKIANCENLKLTELNIGRSDLSSVPANVLVEAISRLKSVYLTETHLTSDQVKSIFRKIANCEDLKLTELHIGWTDLKEIETGRESSRIWRRSWYFCKIEIRV